MTIISQLASSLNRKDEKPNEELASQIALEENVSAVKELISNLSNKDKKIQNDCIKVLYEIGSIQPLLIAAHIQSFIGLLDSKNNRLQWGAMKAIDAISLEKPGEVYAYLSQILDAANKGSVITKDHAVNILIKLCTLKKYSESAFALLNEQLLVCAVNQLPMYTERALPIINEQNSNTFIKTLNIRLSDLTIDSQRKRIEKVLKKVT